MKLLPELTREQVAQALDAVLRTEEFVVCRADQVFKALRMFKASRADFADCLIERSAVAKVTGMVGLDSVAVTMTVADVEDDPVGRDTGLPHSVSGSESQ